MCRRLVVLLAVSTFLKYTEAQSGNYRKQVIKYPSDTQFWATDFFVKGCKNFLDSCPHSYKIQQICARNYDGIFKNFNNYCEMQYENCNSWKNWHVFRRERC
ncbi:uncharacterized protein LOC113497154 [Trichoplusia ni]|uniref:Uncharacterized protein LOC113497154 n=1 Tax=Trichoplusia ni TaxID=7111 RepID=A0A7E5VWA2_TRINI|nr:uncharacterized protein LOC113497154 [Trichoplusia ni]